MSMNKSYEVPVGRVVWVFHPEMKQANAYIVERNGEALDYSGETRRTALEAAIGRKPTEQEVIQWTQMLCPTVIPLLKSAG